MSDQQQFLPLKLARQLDEICCRFEAAWKSAKRPRLEAYLDEVEPRARQALLRELLKIEAHHRLRGGEVPQVDDYRGRLPDAELRWLADMLTAVADPRAQQPSAARSPVPGDASAADGGAVGHYRLLELLGSGGMGQVFKAHHQLMNRVVAVKLIRPDFMHDATVVHRFRREIQAAAQLNHPNVVIAHDAQEADGRHFLVMEYCEGMTLRRLVEQAGPLPAEQACDYVRQAALGLQHAFECGLIHRDLKPDNLMLCGTTIKILDFGLARLREADRRSTGPTRQGVVVGTPDYMAPEQADGHPDIRSDLYALGCTLYFLLAGQPPFPGGSPLDKCLRHRSEQPESLARLRPDLPAPLVDLVALLLAKDAEDRLQTPAELAAALAPFARKPPAALDSQVTSSDTSSAGRALTEPSPTAVLAGEPPRSRSRSRRLAVGLAAVLAAAVVVLNVVLATWKRDDPSPQEERPAAPRTWRKSRTLPFPKGGEELASAYALAFSPDSRLLAVALGNNEDNGPVRPGRVQVWDLEEWNLALDREVEAGTVNCIAFSPDGHRLAWGSGSWTHDVPGRLVLWGVKDAVVKRDFEAHPKGVVGLAFHPAGELLVTSGIEGKVRLWDAKWGAERGELKDAGSPVLALAFSFDGARLAVGSDKGAIDLWDMAAHQPLGPLPDTPEKPIRGLTFSADSQTIVAATKKGEGSSADLLTWQFPGRRPGRVHSLGTTECYCLALAPDGATFVLGCQDRTAKLYQTATCQELQTLNRDHAVLCVAFSPDGRYLATSGDWYGPVELWEQTAE